MKFETDGPLTLTPGLLRMECRPEADAVKPEVDAVKPEAAPTKSAKPGADAVKDEPDGGNGSSEDLDIYAKAAIAAMAKRIARKKAEQADKAAEKKAEEAAAKAAAISKQAIWQREG